MILESKGVDKPYVFTKEWANDTLRYFLRQILYNESVWVKHPQNKVIIANNLIDLLESHGYKWQAQRIRNHLHRWMQSRKGEAFDTSRERGGVS